MLTFSQVVQLGTLLGALVALAALIMGLIEYQRQAALKRADHFLSLRQRLKENDSFKEICNLLDQEDPTLADYPFKEKRDFLGLFEEVALALNSGLIRPYVAHYMFGYYAILCWEDVARWSANVALLELLTITLGASETSSLASPGSRA
jgi:hypothetical protein